MRHLALAAIGIAAAFLIIAILGNNRIAADTPVTVLPAGAVVLHLPISPSVDRIVVDLQAELVAMEAAETDRRIASALARIADDDELLHQVATRPVDMFDSGEAAATATAVYDIQLATDGVTVTVTTVELVPGFGSTARSREHEDGHALINDKIARRCAAESLRQGVESGLQGDALVTRMVAELAGSGDAVHAAYHRYTQSARYGQHIALAKQALTDVPGC